MSRCEELFVFHIHQAQLFLMNPIKYTTVGNMHREKDFVNQQLTSSGSSMVTTRWVGLLTALLIGEWVWSCMSNSPL